MLAWSCALIHWCRASTGPGTLADGVECPWVAWVAYLEHYTPCGLPHQYGCSHASA
jgi:hypothetical protein